MRRKYLKITYIFETMENERRRENIHLYKAAWNSNFSVLCSPFVTPAPTNSADNVAELVLSMIFIDEVKIKSKLYNIRNLRCWYKIFVQILWGWKSSWDAICMKTYAYIPNRLIVKKYEIWKFASFEFQFDQIFLDISLRWDECTKFNWKMKFSNRKFWEI